MRDHDSTKSADEKVEGVAMSKEVLNPYENPPSFHELGVNWAQMKEYAALIIGDRSRRQAAEDALILRQIDMAHDTVAAWSFVTCIADFNAFAARYLRFKESGAHESLLGDQDRTDAIASIEDKSLHSKMEGLLEVELIPSDLANLVYQRSPKTYDEDDPVLGVGYVFSCYAKHKA